MESIHSACARPLLPPVIKLEAHQEHVTTIRIVDPPNALAPDPRSGLKHQVRGESEKIALNTINSDDRYSY